SSITAKGIEKHYSDNEQCLDLGTLFMLDAKQYVVTSYMVKEDPEQYIWQEYTLVCNKEDVIFLTCYAGHWTLVTPYTTQEKFNMNSPSISIPEVEESLRKWSAYRAEVGYAKGSFPYELPKGVIYRSAEWIAPPHSLILEKVNHENSIYRGVYMTPSQLKEICLTPEKMRLPARFGVGATQEIYPQFKWLNWLKVTGFVWMVLFLLHLFMPSSNSTTNVTEIKVSKDTLNGSKVLIGGSFNLGGVKPALLDVSMKSSLINNWQECQVDLVNEGTGAVKSFVLANEFYSGVEGGESWSEGSNECKESICCVEPGRYHLEVMQTIGDGLISDDAIIQASWVTKPVWNLFFLGIASSIVTILVAISNHFFERNRWSSSNFSPYSD
ncbi:MAG TPA: hypothetical protein PLU10_06475, partial [Chitinophagaceae bacterium]|nr:hypothetical protein [Chitinophagaceae bacterium]